MRVSGLLIVLAACSSSASSASDGGGGGGSDGGGGSLTCGSTVAAYCSANACQATLTAAKQDKALCPASLTPCGDYDVIIKGGGIDTTITYYYFQGNLLAIGHAILPARTTCLAGPSTFTPPTCTLPSQNLPACQ